MFALFSLSVPFTSLASLELLCLCKKMAYEQPNSQSSQLDEEGLNKLEEAVSENNACSSSMQGGEVLKCLFVVDERNSPAPRAKMSLSRAKNIFMPKNINSIVV